MMLFILTIILILLAGITNAYLDLSSEDRLGRSWWNKNESWSNKWKEFDPQKGWVEKFPGSSTVFVWVTDGWHLLQFVYNNFWQAAIAVNMKYPVLCFLILKVLYSGIFTLVYRYKKK